MLLCEKWTHLFAIVNHYAKGPKSRASRIDQRLSDPSTFV